MTSPLKGFGFPGNYAGANSAHGSSLTSSYVEDSPIGSLITQAVVNSGQFVGRPSVNQHDFSDEGKSVLPDIEEGDTSPVALAQDERNPSISATSAPIPIIKKKPLSTALQAIFAQSLIPNSRPQEKRTPPALPISSRPLVTPNPTRFLPRSPDDGFDLEGAVKAYYGEEKGSWQPAPTETIRSGGGETASSRPIAIAPRDKKAYQDQMQQVRRDTDDEDEIWLSDVNIRGRQGEAFRREIQDSEERLNGRGIEVDRRQAVLQNLERRKMQQQRARDFEYITSRAAISSKNMPLTHKKQ